MQSMMRCVSMSCLGEVVGRCAYPFHSIVDVQDRLRKLHFRVKTVVHIDNDDTEIVTEDLTE